MDRHMDRHTDIQIDRQKARHIDRLRIVFVFPSSY